MNRSKIHYSTTTQNQWRAGQVDQESKRTTTTTENELEKSQVSTGGTPEALRAVPELAVRSRSRKVRSPKCRGVTVRRSPCQGSEIPLSRGRPGSPHEAQGSACTLTRVPVTLVEGRCPPIRAGFSLAGANPPLSGVGSSPCLGSDLPCRGYQHPRQGPREDDCALDQGMVLPGQGPCGPRSARKDHARAPGRWQTGRTTV